MVMKDGKKVPAYAADGVGKMNKGGMAKKKMMGGGMAKKSMGYEAGGMALKKPTGGAKKLPKAVRNKMGMMNKGGMAKKKAK